MKIVAILIVLLLAIIIVSRTVETIDYRQQLNYCKQNHPSEIKEISTFPHQYPSKAKMQKGYIECCRDYINLTNHKVETECKTFKYNR